MLHNFKAYFHGVAPGALEMTVGRLIKESPSVRFKLSASPVILGREVKSFVIEIACEEAISDDMVKQFYHLQVILKRAGLTSL